MGETPTRMVIKIENEHPLDLLDLTASLGAVANEYRRYSADESCRLYVERISEGSVLASLISHAPDMVGVVAPIIPISTDTLLPFVAHWADLLASLAEYGRGVISDQPAKAADKSTLKNARNFVAPAINGNSITVSGDNNSVTLNQYLINPSVAGDIDRHASHLLASPARDELRFQNEPLKLYQMRDAKAGDSGYIDSFSNKPRRLTFASEAVKREMLHGETSPFDLIFFVTGKAKTAGGDVACYHIEKIDGCTARDAA